MKISKKMEKAINEQINHELFSSYMYLSMAAYFESKNLKGFASWMKKQASEETAHAMKFFDYVFERGGNVELTAISAPKAVWKSPLEAFDDAYNHEMKVTSLINSLVEIASTEKDHATVSFLDWFVMEQVEEEASAESIVLKLKEIGEHKGALFMLDRELGTRQ